MDSGRGLVLDRIDIDAAARRIAGAVRETPLAPFPCPDARIELRLKLECLQETGAFKARGAWNQVSQLTAAEREKGVVTVSSGNHGNALAWAARRAGVKATIVMPADAYPNKVRSCRDHGAEVVLAPSREEADAECAARVAAGAVLVHPFDAERTIEGQGTVGLEIARAWPAVDVVVVPVGGGGLISGCAIALRRALGEHVTILGVEPEGAPKMSRGLQAGEPVRLREITTKVQGLCPPAAGKLGVAICGRFVERVLTLADEEILAAQGRLVREGGWTVEPAGAAAAALVIGGRLPAHLLEGKTREKPLLVAAVVSGGNPDPAQLASVRGR
ncbi:pyridoxal-phosphate dependent enzyme [bacterium]|nr:pyridoxal-phosphate dependent enzyme [bacterium]